MSSTDTLPAAPPLETERLPAVLAPPPSAMLVDVEELRRGLEARSEMVAAIKGFMGSLLKKGVHYDRIPGTDKETLLQPGAEDLALAARAHYEIIKEEVRYLDGGHQDVRLRVRLVSSSGANMGEGVGSCSTLESKYRYRGGSRKCPKCGKEAIIKGKPEYSKRDGVDFAEGGWLCFAKKGGCGAKFKDKAPEILSQSIGQVENPDPADQYNTVLKMALKRAIVGTGKLGFGVSSLFTQDLEEQHGATAGNGEHEAPAPPPPDDGWDRRTQDRPPDVAKAQRAAKKAAAPAPPPAKDDPIADARKQLAVLFGQLGKFMQLPESEPGVFEPNAWSTFCRSQAAAALGEGKADATKWTLDDYEKVFDHVTKEIEKVRTNTDVPF